MAGLPTCRNRYLASVVAQPLLLWLDNHRAANEVLAGPDSQDPVTLQTSNRHLHMMMTLCEKASLFRFVLRTTYICQHPIAKVKYLIKPVENFFIMGDDQYRSSLFSCYLTQQVHHDTSTF